MVNSPFDKYGTWLVAIIIWFVSFWGMYGQSDILHTNFLLIYSVTIGCTGGYLLIVYLIYKHDKKNERKNEERANLIRKKYPNAYESYLADKHISPYNYNSIASINDSDWEKREKVAKALNKEYNDIRYKYYRGFKIWTEKHNIKITWLTDIESSTKRSIIEAKDEIIEIENKVINDEWVEEQSKFSSHCRDLRDELTPEFGCYKYKIKLPVDNNACVDIWQLFANSYCLDKSLDYSFNDSYIKKAELVENHQSFQYELEIDKLCKYIGKLNEDDEVSVYINVRDGWPESFVFDLIESIIDKLENIISIERILIDPLPTNYNRPDKPETKYDEWVKNIERSVVVIDINTENKHVKLLCNKIEKKAKIKRPLLVYFSFYKCFSKEEMKELIEINRKKEEARKREEDERLEIIKTMNLDDLPVDEDMPPNIDDSSKEYELGIPVAETETLRVNYDLPQCNNTNTYCFYTAPDKYSIIFPYRNHRVERRGYTESKFEKRLRQELKYNGNYEVLGDVSILVSDGYHPYEPDIVIIEKDNKYGIRIDIEIDEPYSGYENKPIHYLGCGDERRDRTLADLGWLVIRFSESQIYKEPYSCIYYIKQLICQIDDSFLSSVNSKIPQPVKRWSKEESVEMIQSQSRENLLNHIFSAQEIEIEKKGSPILITQSDYEKKVAEKVETIINNENYRDDTLKEASIEKVITKTIIGQSVKQYIPPSNIYSNSFVDLGLSVKWASCNLGTDKPEGYGNYYAWAEIEPKKSFNWGAYKYLIGSISVLSKYNNNDKYGSVDNRRTLLPEDDVAHILLGEKWRIPTKKEMLELIAECTWVKTNLNGVRGFKITSNKSGYEDRSIFLPAAGCIDNNYFINWGECGYYWNNTLFDGNPTLAYILRFDSEGAKWSYSSRRKGLPIRPVCP